MNTAPIAASALIAAPPQVVYGVIADYHRGHVDILPQPPFVSLVAEEGGRGAGTVIRADLRVLGSMQSFRAVVSEPDPGRVLVETNDTGYVTTFTVEPRAGGTYSFVTISTRKDGGLPGLRRLERWVMERFLRPLFQEELRRLALVAAASDRSSSVAATV